MWRALGFCSACSFQLPFPVPFAVCVLFLTTTFQALGWLGECSGQLQLVPVLHRGDALRVCWLPLCAVVLMASLPLGCAAALFLQCFGFAQMKSTLSVSVLFSGMGCSSSCCHVMPPAPKVTQHPFLHCRPTTQRFLVLPGPPTLTAADRLAIHPSRSSRCGPCTRSVLKQSTLPCPAQSPTVC